MPVTMAKAAFETVLPRDRVVTALALAVLTALAWSYLLWFAADMDMGSMDMSTGLMTPAYAPWRVMDFAFLFAMWNVMMVGMMTPAAAPMIVMYARVGRQAAAQGTPLA